MTIWPGTKFGKLIGFTSTDFSEMSYLHKKDDTIYISFVAKITKRKGVIEELIKNIEKNGYKVAVPTPFPVMEKILSRLGFKEGIEEDEVFGPVIVWRRANG